MRVTIKRERQYVMINGRRWVEAKEEEMTHCMSFWVSEKLTSLVRSSASGMISSLVLHSLEILLLQRA